METLASYCQRLAWNASELARRSDISLDTARKLLAGEGASARIQRRVVAALNQALGVRLTAGEIIWNWET